jgi:hypothetical protein
VELYYSHAEFHKFEINMALITKAVVVEDVLLQISLIIARHT